MAIIADVSNVSVEDRGKYKIAQVTYTSNGKEGKTNVMSFGDGEDVFLTLVAEKRGRFEVSLKQNGKYWNWVSIKKVEGGNRAANAPAASGYSGGGKSFETAEERAERQVLIVRQSALDRAVATLSVGSKSPPDKEAVTALAQYYADWVFQKGSAKPVDKAFEGFQDDIAF